VKRIAALLTTVGLVAGTTALTGTEAQAYEGFTRYSKCALLKKSGRLAIFERNSPNLVAAVQFETKPLLNGRKGLRIRKYRIEFRNPIKTSRAGAKYQKYHPIVFGELSRQIWINGKMHSNVDFDVLPPTFWNGTLEGDGFFPGYLGREGDHDGDDRGYPDIVHEMRRLYPVGPYEIRPGVMSIYEMRFVFDYKQHIKGDKYPTYFRCTVRI
jgi:hypothetical protein